MTKQCFKCKETLPLTMFYKHPAMADGRVNKCKECNKKDVRENRLKNLDYYLEYDKARANLPKRVEARKNYSKTEHGKSTKRKASSKWSKTEHGKSVVQKARSKWAANNQIKIQEYNKTEKARIAHRKARRKWAENNPIKRSASHLVNNAVRDGRLSKPKVCSECGDANKRIHGHHDDYAYPMSVRWLCPKCHREWHKANGEGANV